MSANTGSRLCQRHPSGFAISPEGTLFKILPPIPQPIKGMFQHPRGYRVPAAVHGWLWSVGHRRWVALVSFEEGDCWTCPKC